MIPVIMGVACLLLPESYQSGQVLQYSTGGDGSITRQPAGLVAGSSTLVTLVQRGAGATAPVSELQFEATGNLVSYLAGKTLDIAGTTFAFDDAATGPTYSTNTTATWAMVSYPLAVDTYAQIRIY